MKQTHWPERKALHLYNEDNTSHRIRITEVHARYLRAETIEGASK